MHKSTWVDHILERNSVLKNIHAGERCFILATGPSIKSQNLELLKNEICISVSNFFVHPAYDIIKPKYHCIAPFHLPLVEESWDRWMEDLDKHINLKNPDARVLFSLSDIKRNTRNNTFNSTDRYYFDFSGTMQDLSVNGIDLTKPIIAPQSVPVMALQAAIYMGFNEIYLLGCDHDWIQHINISRHFYQEDEHAVNNYHGVNREWEGSDVESECRAYVTLWQQYKLLRHISNNNNVPIINSTEGGMLDVFPRRDFLQLFPVAA